MKYFTPDEFACKCGTCGLGFEQMDKKLLDLLDDIRQLAGIPFVITSAMRCKEHNKAVGGSSRSSHMRGYAVDIQAKTGADRFKIVYAAMRHGIGRIGVKHSFVHIDTDPELPQQVLWLYV